ncbi:MAG: SapC family protein, partial [Burkholderiaceae bacterium]
ADGKWDAAYIPAFVRRYPFVLQGNDDSEEFVVMIDEEASGFGAEDGERLFADDGKETALLNETLQLLNQYRAHSQQSSALVKHLRKFDLLIPRVVNAVTHQGATFTMNGFSVVDEQRLMALNDTNLLELARNGSLAIIYAHLISLANIQKLLGRLERKLIPA